MNAASTTVTGDCLTGPGLSNPCDERRLHAGRTQAARCVVDMKGGPQVHLVAKAGRVNVM